MFPIRTILHPTDFSESARNAFHVASALARDAGARLVILHVKPLLGPLVAYGEALGLLEPARAQEKLWEILRRFQVPDEHVQVEHRMVEGRPAEQILRIAAEVKPEVIVMGTHGRTGVQHLILGSVAEEVQRKAPCAVLTVRPPQPTLHPAKPPEEESASPAEVVAASL